VLLRSSIGVSFRNLAVVRHSRDVASTMSSSVGGGVRSAAWGGAMGVVRRPELEVRTAIVVELVEGWV
jgi:hypothetical protein